MINFKKFIYQIKTRPLYYLIILIGISVCVFTLCRSYQQLSLRLFHELKEVGNWDSYLYYAVGHGLSEGLIPYREMYENKPPLIFLLASFSYKTWGSYHFLNILAFLSLLIILIFPVVFVILKCIKNKTNLAFSILLVGFTLNCSIIFTLFSQNESSQAQIETLGSACSILCIFFASFTKENSKLYSPFTIFNGLFWGLSAMFKEPFALICGISLLLFAKNKEKLLKCVIYPLFYAIITVFIILILSNCFVPYFTIYLKNMFSSHITIYGSPFERMKNIKIIFDYCYNFSKLLPLIYIATILISVLYNTTLFYSKNFYMDIILKCICGLKPIVFLYITSFVVGLGGQYYNHHFIFSIPYFTSILLDSIDFLSQNKEHFFDFSLTENIKKNYKNKNDIERNMFVIAVFKKLIVYPLMLCFCLLSISSYTKISNPTEDFKSVEIQSDEVKLKAIYIDKILDCLNEESYLWIGFNGYTPFAHTYHLPSGPCFAQDSNNFQEENFFTSKFIEQLNNANVIVTPSLNFNLGIITEQVSEYIKINFSTTIPSSAMDIVSQRPGCFNYIILYRNTLLS